MREQLFVELLSLCICACRDPDEGGDIAVFEVALFFDDRVGGQDAVLEFGAVARKKHIVS